MHLNYYRWPAFVLIAKSRYERVLYHQAGVTLARGGPQRLGYSVRGLANWILDYAASNGAHHTNMGINKLTFFAVEAMLAKHEFLLTNAKIEAWEHGPVFRELYQSFRSFGNGYVTGRAARFSPASEGYEQANLTLSQEDAKWLHEAANNTLPFPKSPVPMLMTNERWVSE